MRGVIRDCPVTIRDVDNTFYIFEESPAVCQGRSTQKQPKAGRVPDFQPLPPQIISKYKDICLAVDLFFANTLVYLTTISEVERSIRTIKEHARILLSNMPFETVPNVLLHTSICSAVHWLNYLPNDSIPGGLSPHVLMTGRQFNFTTHCALETGSYCQVFQDNTPSNLLNPRTIDALSLQPSGNLQGSYKFWCLYTNRIVARRQWKESPMPNHIIEMVKGIAIKEY
mmetsp:Transcript_536/g.881  ORF Transcript_536/g.881 Transcript_536/m.881 type:complete len:227 (+) Transcript_536:1255-1935(+)